MPTRKHEERGRPKYSAPALEKGLDILELLSLQSEPMSLAQIGQKLGRTSGEIFRMLAALERRGYLARGPRPEQYQLTNMLYELAHRHPPVKRLLAHALPIMEDLARIIQQSCHLAVRHESDALIVAQVDCPGFTGFSVRVGAHAPLVDSCSGRVLLAFQTPETRSNWIGTALPHAAQPTSRAGLEATLQEIRQAGFNRQPSLVHHGIVDFGAPILDYDGNALAALTVPSLATIGSPIGETELLQQLRLHVRQLVEKIGSPGSSQA
jgi:DNA-binding IclR family transcriptional regulator